MNTNDRLEQDLTAWLFDTAVPMTMDDADDIIRRTVGVSQRPRWSFLERWIPMRATTLGRPLGRSLPWRTLGLLAALLLLLAAVWAFSVGTRTRLPAPFGPAVNGVMAFSRAGDIVIVDPVTQVERTLVAGPESDAFPLFSNDGSKVVFERSVPTGALLYIVDTAGGEPRSLLEGPEDGAFGLRWAPDDSAVVFSNGDLVVVNIDGSGIRRLNGTARSEGFPMWRPPRGDEILFLGSRDGAQGLFLVGQDGSNLRPVTAAGGGLVDDGLAQWLPDGRILTQRQETGGSGGVVRLHLLTVDADGRVGDDSVVGPPLAEGPIGYTLSRDGTRAIAAIPQETNDGTWRIGVVPLDGNGSVVQTGPAYTGTSFRVAWSPDGRIILVHDPQTAKSWLLDAAGGDRILQTLTNSNADPPAWQAVPSE